jgi:hypothetical protein
MEAGEDPLGSMLAARQLVDRLVSEAWGEPEQLGAIRSVNHDVGETSPGSLDL